MKRTNLGKAVDECGSSVHVTSLAGMWEWAYPSEEKGWCLGRGRRSWGWRAAWNSSTDMSAGSLVVL